MGTTLLRLANFFGLLSGLGLAVVLPILFFIWLGSFIVSWFHFPKAIQLLFVLVGIIVGICNAYLVLRKNIK